MFWISAADDRLFWTSFIDPDPFPDSLAARTAESGEYLSMMSSTSDRPVVFLICWKVSSSAPRCLCSSSIYSPGGRARKLGANRSKGQGERGREKEKHREYRREGRGGKGNSWEEEGLGLRGQTVPVLAAGIRFPPLFCAHTGRRLFWCVLPKERTTGAREQSEQQELGVLRPPAAVQIVDLS